MWFSSSIALKWNAVLGKQLAARRLLSRMVGVGYILSALEGINMTNVGLVVGIGIPATFYI